jgi:hypothetical protein
MTSARKTRVVHAALVALTLWPVAHLVLAARFDISSWKLAGWGMYATPRFPRVGLEVFGRVRASGAIERARAVAPALRSEAYAVIERHRFLRRLVRPDALGRAMLAAHPEWDQVRIVLVWPEVDRRTGMVVTARVDHVYGAAAAPGEGIDSGRRSP